ncbi:hypothetical protein BDV59DRAFT_179839, partial [Aspergillus ambiguus]|uniref:uncharacterized protein n=1 Tax=Aspergillus ambiguus TaxID=176160 RepID=UPI003CCCFF24
MSSTTTTTRTQTSSLSVLADYELHHSGREADTHSSTPQEPPAANTTAQPTNWTRDYRRVPPFRPINRNLDQSERPAGSNSGEFVFIQAMLHGVWLNASVSQL